MDFLMKIVCSQCGFEREVPEERLPGNSAIATCPRCGHRFRISRNGVVEETPPPPPPVSAAPDGDDPLPPGAIIPGVSSESGSDARPESVGAREVPPPLPSAPRSGEQTARDKQKTVPPDGDGDLRKVAADAYERQAAGKDDAASALGNPWDHPERDGYLAAFYQTAMRVMFAASRFFSGLRSDVPQYRALLFYLLVCIFQILVERFWAGVLSSALAPSAATDAQLQQVIQMLSPETSLPLAVLLRTTFAAMELFLAAGLYHIAFRILAPAKANYPLTFQILAYSTAPVLLSIVPVAGSVVGFIWSIACSLIGCRYALQLTWGQIVAALAPLYLLTAVLIMLAIRVVTQM